MKFNVQRSQKKIQISITQQSWNHTLQKGSPDASNLLCSSGYKKHKI